MKVFAISDLHLCVSGAKPMEIFGDGWNNYLEKIESDWNKKVGKDDIVIIAGDISWAMKIDEAILDLQYLSKLNGYKIIIRGNHDYWWQSISNVREKLPENCYALQNDSVKIGNFVLCGTRGWVVPDKLPMTLEDQKIYQRELIRLEMALNSGKNKLSEGDKLIAILHYPPFNQRKEYNEIIGLLKKYNVDTCIFGHIHSNIGRYKIHEKLFDIEFYLTSCDLLQNTLIKIY